MSRQAVNAIIDKAVADDTYFELLRNSPDRALQGYELDPAEISAFRSGAYNVVVRATRKDREEQAAWDAKRAEAEASAARRREQPALAGTPIQQQPKTPVAGLIGFLLGILVIGGAVGGFRYAENVWPWQALGLGRADARAAIPTPTLGARPKPTPAAGRAAPSNASRPAQAAPSASASAGTGQAQLRPSPASPPAAPAASISPEERARVEKAYYQAVGSRLNSTVRSFAALLAGLRAGNNPSKDLADLTAGLADLNQHLGEASPPDQLKQQHQTLAQAMPLLTSDASQMKAALDQNNDVQAILVAAEMSALLNQVPDELAFATAAHPELYQPINSTQQLAHIVNFDVVNQNVTATNNAPAAVQLRIALQAANPSPDEVSDTLRHSVVAARQSHPQAGQVHITAFKETNGQVGAQAGAADWYCSPDAHAPDAGPSGNWQDSCAKIYVNTGGGAKAVPY